MPDPTPKNPHLEMFRLARRLFQLASRHRIEAVPILTPALTMLQPCQADPSFSSVRWFGEPYSFTPPQSKAVEILWAAWERGTPDVRQHYILEAVGSDAGELRDLFRTNHAWGKFIIPGATKGAFRLNDPTKN